VFKQKIKHLLFEHKASVDDLRAENTAALTLAGEEHRVAELELRRDNAALKERMHSEQLRHEQLVKTLKKVSTKDYCDTIRDDVLTCAQKLTQVSLIYRTETTTRYKSGKKNN